MRSTEEVKAEIFALKCKASKYVDAGHIPAAMHCLKKIEALEWVIQESNHPLFYLLKPNTR